MGVTKKVAIVATALLALSGCDYTEKGKGVKHDPSPSPSPSPAAIAPEPADDVSVDGLTKDQIDDVYLTVLRDGYPEMFIVVADEQLIDLGNMICEGFDAGLSWPQEVKNALNAGYTAEQAGYLIGTAVTAYCPEHNDVLP